MWPGRLRLNFCSVNDIWKRGVQAHANCPVLRARSGDTIAHWTPGHDLPPRPRTVPAHGARFRLAADAEVQVASSRSRPTPRPQLRGATRRSWPGMARVSRKGRVDAAQQSQAGTVRSGTGLRGSWKGPSARRGPKCPGSRQPQTPIGQRPRCAGGCRKRPLDETVAAGKSVVRRPRTVVAIRVERLEHLLQGVRRDPVALNAVEPAVRKAVVALRPAAALPAPEGPLRDARHQRRILLARLPGLPPFEEVLDLPPAFSPASGPTIEPGSRLVEWIGNEACHV